jgi:hypothetical protein
VRDVALEDLRGRRWRALAPQLVNQAVARDDLAAMKQQDREQGALPRATESDGSPILDNLQRPQQAKIEHV